MIISTWPSLNKVISLFYQLYSALPFVQPIYTVDQLCESLTPINPPLYCQQVFVHGIMPIKAEILHEAPYVVLFHDVISQGGAGRVLELARPYKGQAMVADLGRLERSIRNSTIGSIQEPGYTLCVVKPWYRTIAALVGLNISTPKAENFALTEYEPGGFYRIHYDSNNVLAVNWRRIATFLVFMNDGSEFTGGNTIFPHLQLAIRPKQGNAIVFYSHTNDGLLDKATMHSGCPVKSGYKWVANIWIRNMTQSGHAAVCRPGEMHDRPEYLLRKRPTVDNRLFLNIP